MVKASIMGFLDILSRMDVRQAVRWERYAKVIQLFGGYSPFLAALVLDFTQRCNLSCQMCAQARARETDGPEQLPPDMPMEVLNRVVADAGARLWPKPMIHLIGGEVMLHAHFLEAVAEIKAHGLKCGLTTNAYFLEPYAGELVRLGLDTLRISLDGPEEIHNTIRRNPRSFGKAMQGIAAVRREQAQQRKSAPQLGLNCVMTGINQFYLYEMVDIAAEVGVPSLTLQHLVFEDGYEHGIAVPQLVQSLPALRAHAREKRVALSFYPPLTISQIERYYERLDVDSADSCILPWFITRVTPDGSLSPCRGFSFANVFQEGFSLKRAWNNPAIRQYRRVIARQGVFSDCGRCCHRLYA